MNEFFSLKNSKLVKEKHKIKLKKISLKLYFFFSITWKLKKFLTTLISLRKIYFDTKLGILQTKSYLPNVFFLL